jgi:maltooligosyltrehalose trehalohydrolase
MSTERLKVAAALVLTAPFIPMLFQGEEWGASTPFQYFTDHQDPELGKAVSEGRRSEFSSFGWSPEDVPDPQDPTTFERSKLEWGELEKEPHAELLDWHRRLVALRRARPELRDGRLDRVEVDTDGDGRWLVLSRGDTRVAVNVGDTAVTLPMSGSVLLASSPDVSGDGSGVTLPPDSVAITG